MALTSVNCTLLLKAIIDYNNMQAAILNVQNIFMCIMYVVKIVIQEVWKEYIILSVNIKNLKTKVN